MDNPGQDHRTLNTLMKKDAMCFFLEIQCPACGEYVPAQQYDALPKCPWCDHPWQTPRPELTA